MKYGVSIKINVKQIDKERLFKGKEAIYLDATVFLDTDNADQFGNHGMLTQDVSKDERGQGVKGNILGNAKIFYTAQSEPPQGKQQYQNNPQQQIQGNQQQGYQAPDQQPDQGQIPF